MNHDTRSLMLSGFHHHELSMLLVSRLHGGNTWPWSQEMRRAVPDEWSSKNA
jgi:hypothetical protein